ncbi:uracil/xanthine transporter [Lysinibacillus telephonicus]|uniref:Uracil/xanthine transporter n=1 Tax=Lysinibacillus telephonicus TaxID=1714840 RepID=A0A3S0HMN1_9BACI|nr:uracil/xanthine transporter [Lysinibacillus telephonicus]RTQ93228.1 uracil/xanthine transporter [Lysinibacillus telephonicus]
MNQLSYLTTAFASLQWLFFIFANTIVVPISVGTAFDLPQSEIATILRSSLIFTGIACMLQGYIGHRYPLMEGHSGVMWGLVLNLCLSASAMGMSLPAIGGGIATGMLLAGAVVLILGAFKLVSYIQKIFTPMVMTVYLFLLTFQLIIIFFTGMLKVSPEGELDIPISLFSVGIVLLVSFIKIKGKNLISNFAILIGMVVGWILYLLLFPTEQAISTQGSLSLTLFPLGTPNLNIGIIAITFLASIINLSNTIASVQAASNLLEEKISQSSLDRSYLLTGSYSIVAAVLGLVSYAPFASSIGFLESTRIFDRKPFIIGGGLMAVLGIIPFLGSLLATLPVTVGNAVLFVAYLQLFGTSLKSLNGYIFNSVTIHRLAAPVLIGVCIMNLDVDLFKIFPVYFQPLLSNGFIMGVLISVGLEIFIKWDE